MANDQLATVILKLITDNKEFAEGLKNALQLTAITSTQMKDLMEFKIKAPDFSALDLTVETNQKKISELVKSQSEQTAASRDEGAAADEAGAKIKGHGELVDTGAKSIQQFRSEQRLQNFVIQPNTSLVISFLQIPLFTKPMPIQSMPWEGEENLVFLAAVAGGGNCFSNSPKSTGRRHYVILL